MARPASHFVAEAVACHWELAGPVTGCSFFDEKTISNGTSQGPSRTAETRERIRAVKRRFSACPPLSGGRAASGLFPWKTPNHDSRAALARRGPIQTDGVGPFREVIKNRLEFRINFLHCSG